MTPKQQRFVGEYLIDLNATQAAIRAGYSERTAGKIGGENLQKPEIQKAITAALEARSQRTELTQDWVLERLKSEAENEGETGSASARVRAAELVGKHLGMFVDKRELTGKDGKPLFPSIRVLFEGDDGGD